MHADFVEGLADPLDALLGAEHLRGVVGLSEGEKEEEGEELEGESVTDDESGSDEEMAGVCVSHGSVVEGMPTVFSTQQDNVARGQAVTLQISKSGWRWKTCNIDLSLLAGVKTALSKAVLVLCNPWS